MYILLILGLQSVLLFDVLYLVFLLIGERKNLQKLCISPNETFILFLWKLSHNILFKRNTIEMGQSLKFQKHSKEWFSLFF